MSRIAVILPVYSGDQLIHFRQSLESLIGQSYQETDIVLLIDGPVGDDLTRYIQSRSSVISKIMEFDKNHGLPYVLNRGLEYSLENDYEFIARMDADDISDQFRMEKQINFLCQNPETDIVGGAIEEIDENGNPRNKTITYPLTHKDCFRFFKKRDPVAHPAVMFRKSFFMKAGFYNELYRINQDTQLWFNGFMNDCRFANIADVVIRFRFSEQFFKKRRGGIRRAQKILKERIHINRELDYGLSANLYAYSMFLMTISPVSLRKLAYRMLR